MQISVSIICFNEEKKIRRCLESVKWADEIVVIEDGRITQRGTHDELIARPGYYRELNTLQQIERNLETQS